MNTIFKFYNALWNLLGVTTVVVIPRVILGLWQERKSRLATYLARTALIVFPLLYGAASFGSLVDIWVMSTFARIDGPRPTLNGAAYLEQHDGDESRMINWLNANVRGTPTTVEAWGPSYQFPAPFTRVTMHTGIPTVLGWDFHVSQRGTPGDEIQNRRRDILAIYADHSPERAIGLLRKYGVELIIIGNLERSTYPPLGLKKFSEHPDLFPLLFESGPVQVYTTNYSDRWFLIDG